MHWEKNCSCSFSCFARLPAARILQRPWEKTWMRSWLNIWNCRTSKAVDQRIFLYIRNIDGWIFRLWNCEIFRWVPVRERALGNAAVSVTFLTGCRRVSRECILIFNCKLPDRTFRNLRASKYFDQRFWTMFNSQIDRFRGSRTAECLIRFFRTGLLWQHEELCIAFF